VDAATRELITSGTDQDDVTGGNACWQTPPAIYDKLDSEFQFDIDLFSDNERALHQVFFGPGSELAEDALTVDWVAYGEAGFSNPPYGRFIRKVLAKAVEQAQCGFTSVHLIPHRMTVPVRQALFRSKSVREWLIPSSRITFFENGKPRLDSKGNPMPALFDSTILVFSPGVWETPRVREWKVPDHVPATFRKGRKQAA
jgi:phage N-6-adenine-methyltransferase